MKRGWTPLTPGVLPGGTVGEQPKLQDAPLVGTCLSITAAGVKFTIPQLAPYAFGPAPWNVGGYSSAAAALAAGFAPHAGDTVLVVFAGVGTSTPWIVGWTR